MHTKIAFAVLAAATFGLVSIDGCATVADNDDDDDSSGTTGGTESAQTETTMPPPQTSSTTSTTGAAESSTTGDPSTTEPPLTTTGESDTTTTGGPETTTTSDAQTCGWGELGPLDEVPFGYLCGGEGADPTGEFPYGCPVGLAVGGDCQEIGVSAEGCCDVFGNAWYCADPDGGGPMQPVVTMEEC
jgi:hypothetical protein